MFSLLPRWAPEGEGTWSQPCLGVCWKAKEMALFLFQVNKMNEKMSFKIGVKSAASVYVGKDVLDV